MAYTNIKKNDTLILEASSLLPNGNAICKNQDGFVVFVPGAAPGDIVKVHVIKVTKNYAVAKIIETIQPSLYRNEDGCPFMNKCGGCVFQHITYDKECELKNDIVNDALSRIAKFDIKTQKFYGAESIRHYRNKAVYPLGISSDGLAISGFYSRMSHRICEHDECAISNPDFVKIRDFVLEFLNQNKISVYNEETHKGLVRNIYLRSTKDNSTSLTLILCGKNLVSEQIEKEFASKATEKFPFIKTILINENYDKGNVILGEKWRTLYGDGYIYDELLGKKFRITPASFWQVNREQAELLYSIARDYAELKDDETLLDLYCGTGSVGICIANQSTKLYGVEVIEEAVIDAQFNASLNNINAHFFAAGTENALDDERLLKLKPDVITVDPPRKGCVGAVEKIAKLGAKRIVYISCDPATLARDLAEFETLGYKTQKVSAVDMFPRTGHVESVVLLSQQN